MRVTSFLATIEGNVAVSQNFYFILSVIHIISVRLLSFGTRVLLSFGTCRCHFCLKSYGYLRLKSYRELSYFGGVVEILFNGFVHSP